MISRIVTSAVFAGAATGLIFALLHFAFIQPVLLHAELYETGQLVHFGGPSISATPELPAFDLMRNGLSVLISMMLYFGYALILVAVMSTAEQSGVEITARTGLIWGLAGFVATQLAPAISLPPEVPGVAAADVQMRQYWWFATVAMAAGAMWLLAFRFSMYGIAGAALLLLLPHIVGAPQPAAFEGPVPTEIGALFAARSLGVGLAVWMVLGGFCAYFWNTEEETA